MNGNSLSFAVSGDGYTIAVCNPLPPGPAEHSVSSIVSSHLFIKQTTTFGASANGSSTPYVEQPACAVTVKVLTAAQVRNILCTSRSAVDNEFSGLRRQLPSLVG
jgi:hypothetical protein